MPCDASEHRLHINNLPLMPMSRRSEHLVRTYRLRVRLTDSRARCAYIAPALSTVNCTVSPTSKPSPKSNSQTHGPRLRRLAFRDGDDRSCGCTDCASKSLTSSLSSTACGRAGL